MNTPDGAEIRVRDDSFGSSFDLDRLEKGPDTEYSVAEMVTGDALVASGFYDETELLGELESRAYDLELDVRSLRVYWVSGVKYSTKSNPVVRYRPPKEKPEPEPSDSGAPL